MTLRSSLCLAFGFAAVLGASLRGQAPPPRGTAVVIGQVVDATDGRPVPRAIVRLRTGGGGGGSVVQTRIADDRGRYYFRNIPAGTYGIVASRIRFIDGAYGKRRAGGTGIPLVLYDRQIVANAVIELFRPGSISGFVVDEGNDPVVGAQVIAYRRQLVANGWRLVPAAARQTDDEGRYRLFDLVPGEYVVSVPGMTVSLPTAPFEEVGRTGSTTAEMVALVVFSGIGSLERNLRDVDGRTAMLRPLSPQPPAPIGAREFTYPTQYFPAGDTPTTAMPVSVESGRDFFGVNFQLRPTTAVRIDGQAFGPDGPASGQMLRLVRADAEDHGFGTETSATLTEHDGSFSFVQIPPGHYRIEARTAISMIVSPNSGRPATLGGQLLGGAVANPTSTPTRDFEDVALSVATVPLSRNAMAGRTDVTVGDEDVRDVRLMLTPPIDVSGRVTFEGPRRATTDERGHVRVALEPAEATAMALAPVQPGDAGEFTFSGVVPGQYFVRISGAPPGWSLRAATSRGRDVTETPLDVSGSHADISIVFTTRGTNITGTVRDAIGMPVRAGTVIAFPASVKDTIAASSHRTREVRASTYGVYSLDGLPPGEYLIAAIDDAAAEGWQDARVLQQLRAAATRVTLREGEQRSLELRIIPRK